MRRKIVRHGTATLTISLPSSWVKQFNIKAGNELEIIPKGKELLISTENQNAQKKTTFPLVGEDYLDIEKAVLNLYRTGYDEIKITYWDPNTSLKIKKILPLFIGFEVIDQTATSCTLKNINPQVSLDFNSTFRRNFLLVIQEYDFIVKNINALRQDDLKMINQLNFEVRKFTLFCQRILNEIPIDGDTKSSYFRVLSKLMKTSQNCFELYSRIYQYKHKIKKETVEYLKKARQLFIDSYDAFYKKKMKLLPGLNKQKWNLGYQEFQERIQHKADFDNVLYFILSNNINLTCTFSLLPILTSFEEEKNP